MEKNFVEIFNIPFINMKKEEILKILEQRVVENKKTYVVTANAEIVMYAKENVSYFNIITKADYIVPDGIGVVKGAQILKKEIKERVPGIELMVDLLKIANKFNQKIYFYGAKNEVIEKMIKRIKSDYPNINIVGYSNGYINDSDNKITDEIINLEPDYVFVAKGAPLQDEWINKVIQKTNKGLFMGVGGSFDVLAGEVKRAPEIWQKLNLEWLYRIAGDPKRWKRSMALPKFVIEVLKLRISK